MPTPSKRFLMVSFDSSMAMMPLPAATMAWAVSASWSMLMARRLGGEAGNYSGLAASIEFNGLRFGGPWWREAGCGSAYSCPQSGQVPVDAPERLPCREPRTGAGRMGRLRPEHHPGDRHHD